MKRKQFIESFGATCKNWTWSWSFVNHDEKLVIFGAWDDHTLKELHDSERYIEDADVSTGADRVIVTLTLMGGTLFGIALLASIRALPVVFAQGSTWVADHLLFPLA